MFNDKPVMSRGYVLYGLLTAVLFMVAGSSDAQTASMHGIGADRNNRDAPGRISWRDGVEYTYAMAPDAIAGVIEDVLAEGGKHLVVQLRNPATASTRAALQQSGIELQTYLGDDAWFASITSARLDMPAVLSTNELRYAGPTPAERKLHPILLRGETPDWIVVNDGQTSPKAAVYVVFHRDVDLAAEATPLCRRYGAVIRSRIESVNALVIELPRSAVDTLAACDAVQWIEPALPRLSGVNDSNREITQADMVRAPPYGLDGAGVTALIYDVGSVYAEHADFAGRLINGDGTPPAEHSTHVAGSLGGDGFESDGLYRGMAPGVSIVSYGIGSNATGLPLYSDPGDIERDYREAMTLYGVDLATNSVGTNTCRNGFSCDITGNYGVTASVIDSLVHGGLGRPIIALFANGNERACERCRDAGVHTPEGYHSTAPPACAKNHISVGAINSNDDSMTFFSSWGPTDDGRIKPDIVGPGCQLTDDAGVTSCTLGGGYAVHCGTSMATPTVAGLCSLLLQDFHLRFPERPNPLNSTVKALLAHNAVDLGNPGPDYQAGYGSVRIRDTIDFARLGYAFERTVDQGETYTFLARVEPGETELKITLAWDDPPAAPNALEALINDLDLVVLDPAMNRRYPWTLDPADPNAPAVRAAPDRLNVIEQVVVEDPAPGLWTVQVLAYDAPVGPQVFSICGSPRLALDCDGDAVPDDEQIAANPSLDCTDNGVLDVCEPDCNENDRADSCDIADGLSEDCDDNGVPDECQPDCNDNGAADACDILEEASADCDLDGVPDECQNTSADCNENEVWDACDIFSGFSLDLNYNGVPDECEAPRLIYVDDDAPDDPAPGDSGVSDPEEDGTPEHPFDAIQEGIDAALDGDTVIVADGVYAWIGNINLSYHGKNIVVKSANGPDNCVIDCEGLYRGVIFQNGETPAARLEGITIYDGFDGLWGGAIFCVDSSPTLANCVFDNNWGVVGGALYFRSCSSAITDCVFKNNFGGYGGGLFITGQSDPVVTRCRFRNNTSLLGGSAATLFGAGAPRLIDCRFKNNEAYEPDSDNAEGGALLIATETSLVRCIFEDNVCTGGGGAMFCRPNCNAVLANCVFINNLALGTFSDGGGLALDSADAALTGCTFLANSADRDGGGLSSLYDSRVSMENCILWGNQDRFGDGESAQFSYQGLYPDVRYCCIQGYSGLFGSVGCFDADPLAADATDGDYHLLPGSPCANAGNPAFLALPDETDLDGEPRVMLGRVDVGADEFAYLPDDCNDNGTPDADEIAANPALDCDASGVLDECELALGLATDCNENGMLDACDIADGTSFDSGGNGVPDECEPDCNENGTPDDFDLAEGLSADCNQNLVPDECEPDCNENGAADECDLLEGVSEDFNHNGTPDECEENRAIFVDDDGPSDPGPGTTSLSDPLEDGSTAHPYDSIQEAVDAAISGDLILIADGVYAGFGNKFIEFHGRQVTIRGDDGPLRCIINCEDSGRAFLIRGSATRDTVIENLTVTNGSYSAGGGVYCTKGAPIIRNCIIVGNVSWYSNGASGGGIYLNESDALIQNCLIAGNTGSAGAGIACAGESSPMIVNCTIAGNSADNAGAGVSCEYGAAPTIVNTLIWGNVADHNAQMQSVGENAAPAVSYCNVEGGAADVLVADGAALEWDAGNLDDDPRFLNYKRRTWIGEWDADASYDEQTRQTTLYDDDACWVTDELVGKLLTTDAGAFVQGLIASNTRSSVTVWGDYAGLGLIDVAYEIHDYQIATCSPCIDSGDNAATNAEEDLDAAPRRVDDPATDDVGAGAPPLVDIGAYEFQADCAGDLNGDRTVDHVDLIMLLQDYGRGDAGDLDCDGDTDLSDLAAVLGTYGHSCP